MHASSPVSAQLLAITAARTDWRLILSLLYGHAALLRTLIEKKMNATMADHMEELEQTQTLIRIIEAKLR